ncbi:hypothetical protein [Cellulomonas bogoriensis]|uniref:Uncharacterized protein n=1 Tax=Cellulomonas bogoriensis 69B4 = DSM 16987 TaxID=1386082 RepID=A0A0A0BPR8_9CELL|nr:hypothetical protein [Cellulomonas bogoriensis]KGM09074.1 hypothetical protein N869_08265 [Cellulomonas bogoriensis 69B4 = DSM 16987]
MADHLRSLKGEDAASLEARLALNSTRSGVDRAVLGAVRDGLIEVLADDDLVDTSGPMAPLHAEHRRTG